MNFIQNIDNQIILNIYEFIKNKEILKNILVFITNLGDLGIIWIVFAFLFYFKNSTKKNGFIMITSLFIGFFIGNLILKNVIARERPFTQLDFIPLITPPTDFSFPSGHSLSSFVGATTIFMFNRKLGAFAYVLAVLIAISRVLLTVHYPTDVIVGAILGIFIGYFSFKIMNSKINFKE